MQKIYSTNNAQIYFGDSLKLIDELPDNLIQTVITSPTYWGKRQFTSDPDEFGKESLEKYVERNVTLYAKILQKMKKSGSLFVIIQDSFMGSGISRSHHNHWENNKNPEYVRDGLNSQIQGNTSAVTAKHAVIKNKSLVGIPYRIAIKLVDMGYIWRQHIIWEKPNPMPENVTDRLRQSCEYILHFTKHGNYVFNNEYFQIEGQSGKLRMQNQVWVATPEPKKGHTATFPTKIVEKLLLATSNKGDTVFEPFLGSGTMYYLSMKHKRNFIGGDISLTLLERFFNDIKQTTKFSLDKYLFTNNMNNDSNNATSLETTLTLLQELKQDSKDIIEIENKKQEFFRLFIDSLIKFSYKEADKLHLSINSRLPAIFKKNGKSYQFNGCLEIDSKTIVLEIPSIQDFDSKKGAGSYYAALRISEAISSELITAAILFIPEQSKGGKYLEIIQKANGKIFLKKLTQKSAENIISKIVNDKQVDELNDVYQWLKSEIIV